MGHGRRRLAKSIVSGVSFWKVVSFPYPEAAAVYKLGGGPGNDVGQQ